MLGVSLLLIIGVAGVSCRQDMHDQPKYEPLEASTFYADGQASRPPVEGTVARGMLKDDPLFYAGKLDSDSTTRPTQQFADAFPFPVTAQVLDVGQTQFNVFCSVCHDPLGTGDGMIVRRGYRKPPSLHTVRLRQAPAGYFFDVITNGFGAMPDYAAQISPRDRWAVVAYIRALQLSQNATLGDVPADERATLESQRQKQ
jgi:mono/diheme cytochrome c family protein